MSIQTDLTRLQSAKVAIKAAIEGKGVTVPNATMLDGMAALIDSIEAGGGDALKAFAQLPDASSSSAVVKNVVPVPAKFAYKSGYTGSAQSLSVSIDVSSGDTVIAGVAMRKITNLPTIPDGWELVQYVPALSGDTIKQCLLVLKATAGTDGTLTLTLTQEDASQRFYMLLLNLKDSKVYDSTQCSGGYLRGNFSLELPYEHNLVLASSPITSTDTGTIAWRIYSVLAEKYYMPNANDGASLGGRLCAMMVPYKSQQPEGVLRGNNFPNDSPVSNTDYYLGFCILGITPGTCTRWIASDGTRVIGV